MRVTDLVARNGGGFMVLETSSMTFGISGGSNIPPQVETKGRITGFNHNGTPDFGPFHCSIATKDIITDGQNEFLVAGFNGSIYSMGNLAITKVDNLGNQESFYYNPIDANASNALLYNDIKLIKNNKDNTIIVLYTAKDSQIVGLFSIKMDGEIKLSNQILINSSDSRYYIEKVMEISEDQYIVVGNKNDGDSDGFYLTFDSDGNFSSPEEIGTPNNDYFSDISTTVNSNEGYAIIGHSNGFGFNHKPFIIKLDKTTLYQNPIQHFDGINNTNIYTDKIFTLNDGYFIIGKTNSSQESSTRTIYFAKTDCDGNIN